MLSWIGVKARIFVATNHTYVRKNTMGQTIDHCKISEWKGVLKLVN